MHPSGCRGSQPFKDVPLLCDLSPGPVLIRQCSFTDNGELAPDSRNWTSRSLHGLTATDPDVYRPGDNSVFARLIDHAQIAIPQREGNILALTAIEMQPLEAL